MLMKVLFELLKVSHYHRWIDQSRYIVTNIRLFIPPSLCSQCVSKNGPESMQFPGSMWTWNQRVDIAASKVLGPYPIRLATVERDHHRYSVLIKPSSYILPSSL